MSSEAEIGEAYSQTFAAIQCGAESIREHAKNGGQFDFSGEDGFGAPLCIVAVVSAMKNISVLHAFKQAGGQFTEQKDELGNPASFYAIQAGPKIIEEFSKCGGVFDENLLIHNMPLVVFAEGKGPETHLAFCEAILRQKNRAAQARLNMEGPK